MHIKKHNAELKLDFKLFYYGLILLLLATILPGCDVDVARVYPETSQFGVSSSPLEKQDKQIPDSQFKNNLRIYSNLARTDHEHIPAEHSLVTYGVRSRNNETKLSGSLSTTLDATNKKLAPSVSKLKYPGYASVDPIKIVVRRGDTLYSISKKYDITVSSIKRTNNLADNIIRRGQILTLVPRTLISSKDMPTNRLPHVEFPKSSLGTHEVQPGETLYSISRLRGISISNLKELNGIKNPRKLRIGQILKLSGSHWQNKNLHEEKYYTSSKKSEVISREKVVAPVTVEAENIIPPKGIVESSERSIRRNKNTFTSNNNRFSVKKASINSKNVNTNLKFSWPVVGRIVRGFGILADGTQSDGINIAVPLGHDVKASEKGTVVYAGNELREYGNLILIHHEDGYITVYAHLGSILSERGEDVHRGQIIAKAGNSGISGQSQLHFEIRQGSKPIDPLAHLDIM
ncbi:MAG: hypothetical protein TECD_00944 [Hyphomicrobiaceae bacterium hypho_1]